MTRSDDAMVLRVRVFPRAKRNEVGGERDGRLVVRTTAPPLDDRANTAVRKQIAEHLGVALSRVQIASGHHSRDKVLRIQPVLGEGAEGGHRPPSTP